VGGRTLTDKWDRKKQSARGQLWEGSKSSFRPVWGKIQRLRQESEDLASLTLKVMLTWAAAGMGMDVSKRAREARHHGDNERGSESRNRGGRGKAS